MSFATFPRTITFSLCTFLFLCTISVHAKNDRDWNTISQEDKDKTVDWQKQFSDFKKSVTTLSDSELQAHQLPAAPAEILIHLDKGLKKKVLKNR